MTTNIKCKCKKTTIFTKHQKNLKEKYCKTYGNTKLHTLKFNILC